MASHPRHHFLSDFFSLFYYFFKRFATNAHTDTLIKDMLTAPKIENIKQKLKKRVLGVKLSNVRLWLINFLLKYQKEPKFVLSCCMGPFFICTFLGAAWSPCRQRRVSFLLFFFMCCSYEAYLMPMFMTSSPTRSCVCIRIF